MTDREILRVRVDECRARYAAVASVSPLARDTFHDSVCEICPPILGVLRELEAAEKDGARLVWIACASRQEIEAMLMHTICDNVDDMRRFIDERIAEAKP